jgi:hypothetical protein
MADISDEEVEELEARVSYLEEELDISLLRHKFERRVRTAFPQPTDTNIEIKEQGYHGYFARVTGIDGDDLEVALSRLDDSEYETAITETADGLGLEIWIK